MASNDQLMDKMSEAASRVYDNLDSLESVIGEIREALEAPNFTSALESAKQVQDLFFKMSGDLEGILDLEGQIDSEE